MDVQWYPGHMAKALRELQNQLQLVDVAIEICDARVVASSRNPELGRLLQNKPRILLMNKSDLADPVVTDRWLVKMRAEGVEALAFNAAARRGTSQVIQAIGRAAAPKVEAAKRKGVRKTVRVAVVGVPNVGKSTLINCLAGAARARVQDKPGVTRGKQWVRLGDFLELMDTPGLLWPRLEDPKTALLLAFTGAIRDTVRTQEELAQALLQDLETTYPKTLEQRYGLVAPDPNPLDTVCRKRGFLLPGGQPDSLRAAQAVLDEFRAGRLGRISLEVPSP